jgi:hypothetical protein
MYIKKCVIWCETHNEHKSKVFDKIKKSISKLTVHVISPGPKINRLDTNNSSFVKRVTNKLS